MALSEFIFAENVSIDRFEEGALIVDDQGQKVVCLGKFETSILDLLLTKGMIGTVSALSQQYDGDRIDSDIDDFCNELINRNIIIKR